MAKYASARRATLQARRNALTPEQFKTYTDSRAGEIARAEQANGGRPLADETTEEIDDHLLTWAATGYAPDLPADEYQALVDHHETEAYARQIRLKEAAARAVKAEAHAGQEQPQIIPLDVFLEDDDEDAAYRIDSVFPTGGNIMLSAQYKAGKTTLAGNLTRSLVDGTPFLGRFAVQPVQERDDGGGGVLIFDNELDARQSRRWFREQNIVNTTAVEVVHLRGKLSTFNILDPAIRAAWARRIEGADVVILDCLRPVLDALGLSEDKDAGKFLVAWDALLAEASAQESVVVHHMGHNGERSRGDSRLQDWPDATWKLIREDPDDPASARYFSAFGRDVDVTESRLEYDLATRHLTLAGGSRKEAKTDEVMPALVQLLSEHDALSGREVEKRLTEQGYTQKAVRAALLKAHHQKRTVTYLGPHRATMHSLNAKYGTPESVTTPANDTPKVSPFAVPEASASSALPVRQRTQNECVSASIEDALHSVETKPTALANTPTHSACPLHAVPQPDSCYTCEQVAANE